jgi:transposase-like protein
MRIKYGERLACPKCGKAGKFHRLTKELAFSCAWCGHHIHPLVGTPFMRTHTPLQKWFYALYLFTTTRHGVPAKELQRQLGVTYKTAWRMGHEIRKYMAIVDGDRPLGGIVEVDETYVGGQKKGSGLRGRRGKTIVLGMAERYGAAMTKVVPDATHGTLTGHVRENAEPGSIVSTDDNRAYWPLKSYGYDHESVNHSAGEYVRGLFHTNTLECLWSMLKRSISGTHVSVSPKHLPKYLAEFEFRWNLRNYPHLMFPRLLQRL